MFFFLISCTQQKSTSEQDTSVPDESRYCEPTQSLEKRILYGHVGDLNTSDSNIPTGTEANALTGVSITNCNTGQTVFSDAEGNWTIDVPEQEFVTFQVHFDGYIESRWTIDPHHDGTGPDIKDKYSNTIATSDFLDEIFEASGHIWDKNNSIIVVDVVNPNLNDPITGPDLIGSVVTLQSPHEIALVVDDEERFLIEGNTLSQNSDVIFLNVEPGELFFDIVTPDDSICSYPQNRWTKANEIFHLSVYCY